MRAARHWSWRRRAGAAGEAKRAASRRVQGDFLTSVTPNARRGRVRPRRVGAMNRAGGGSRVYVNWARGGAEASVQRRKRQCGRPPVRLTSSAMPTGIGTVRCERAQSAPHRQQIASGGLVTRTSAAVRSHDTAERAFSLAGACARHHCRGPFGALRVGYDLGMTSSSQETRDPLVSLLQIRSSVGGQGCRFATSQLPRVL